MQLNVFDGHGLELSWGNVGIALEHSGKVLRAGIAEPGGDVGDGQFRVGQPAHGLIHLGDVDIIVHSDIHGILENGGQVAGCDLAGAGNVGQTDLLPHMVADKLDGLDDQRVFYDKDLAVALFDFPRKEIYHLVDIYF